VNASTTQFSAAHASRLIALFLQLFLALCGRHCPRGPAVSGPRLHVVQFALCRSPLMPGRGGSIRALGAFSAAGSKGKRGQPTHTGVTTRDNVTLRINHTVLSLPIERLACDQVCLSILRHERGM